MLRYSQNYLSQPKDVYEIARLKAENKKLKADDDKLRELAKDMYHIISLLDFDQCACCPRDDINHPCPRYMIGECTLERDMRELGIEAE